MTDKPDLVGAASLFNFYVADWGNRVNIFLNYLIVVSGGILSITIGAFLSGNPPTLSPEAIHFVRCGWALLSAGLVLALLTSFLHIIAQATSVIRMKREAQISGPPGVIVIHGSMLFRIAIWVVFSIAFACTISGVVYICSGASQLLAVSS